jgi:hypothetical protein
MISARFTIELLTNLVGSRRRSSISGIARGADVIEVIAEYCHYLLQSPQAEDTSCGVCVVFLPRRREEVVMADRGCP